MSIPLFDRPRNLICKLPIPMLCLATAACAANAPPSLRPSALPVVHSEKGARTVKSAWSCLAKPCIYVTNSTDGTGQGSVTIYPLDASGNTEPIATIAGPDTGLDLPQAVSVDKNHNIYVSNYRSALPTPQASITVYAAGASGDSAPIANISGSNTGLEQNFGIGVDTSGNIFVSENHLIEAKLAVFPAGATGNVAPIRTIRKRRGEKDNQFLGVALDMANRIYIASPLSCECSGESRILVYDHLANYVEKPLQNITGNHTFLILPNSVAVDRSDNIYVSNHGNGDGFGFLTVYAASSTGDVAPI